MDFQPWKISNKKIKNEEDTAALSALRPPAFQRPSLLPVVQEGHSTTSGNALLPSIESPGQDTFHDPENEENCDPSLQTSFNSSERALDSSHSVSTTEVSGSQSANFTPLIQQNRDFNVQLHELRSEVDQIKKEKDIEHQEFIKIIASLREELRSTNREPTSRESTQGKIMAKALKVDTALTEYNNAARALRTSLDSLAVELELGLAEKEGQEKHLQDLGTTVHTMKSSMMAVETYFDPQQQKFRDNMKALGTMG